MRISIRRFTFAVLLVIGCLQLSACGGGSGDDDVFRYDPGLPGKVTGLQADSGVTMVTLSWTPQWASSSYRVYYVSSLESDVVTKENSTVIDVVGRTSQVIEGLTNDVKYYFAVTARNPNGEGEMSAQIACTPGPFTDADLVDTWYFHTLVSGAGARWEKGTLEIEDGIVSISFFEDSSGDTSLPLDFGASLSGEGVLNVTDFGAGDWHDFHGTMSSSKNLIVATYSPDPDSSALCIFQRKAPDLDSDGNPYYNLDDFTGMGDRPLGDGPTRFTYHQLYSGASTEWEYCNGKVGKKGVGTWLDTIPAPGEDTAVLPYKGSTYWDYSTPTFKTSGRGEVVLGEDWSSKATAYGIDGTGLLTEYWGYDIFSDPVDIPNFNDLVPLKAHDTVFTGRMTREKTMVIGVHTRTDASGANPQYFMRIIQLCFKPVDMSIPEPDINDLIGDYKFHKIAAATPDSATPGEASWSYGALSIEKEGDTGVATFSDYVDNDGNTVYPVSLEYPDNTLTFSYYDDRDINAIKPIYPDFANYTTSVVQETNNPHYYSGVDAIRDYKFWQFDVDNPAAWLPMRISTRYYNEHATMSLNRDVLVMTRTDALGYTMMVGVK